MALRNILNVSTSSLQKLKHARHFSSSTIPESLYKPSLPLLSTPWLMLPPDVKDGQNGPTDNYLNILDKTMVKIDRQLSHGNIPHNTICVGTTQGWVAFSCDSDNSVFLAHPYKQGCSIKLPPSNLYKFRTGLNCTLVGNPTSEKFAPISLGRWGDGIHIGNNEGWTGQPNFRDTDTLLAYNRKTDTVYKLQWSDKSRLLKITCWDVLGGNGDKQSFELNDPLVEGLGKNGPVLSSFMFPFVYGDKKIEPLMSSFMDPELDPEWKCVQDHDIVKFLVVREEPGKPEPVLFLVIRYFTKEEGVQSETKRIQLLRIDLETGTVEYVRSLGNQALFLGENSEPFFLSTMECPGLKSNSVYIADDMGVYDLETRCVTPFLSLGDLANTRPQVYWLAPS